LTLISSAAVKGGPHQQHMPHSRPTKTGEPSDKTEGQSRYTSITWLRKLQNRVIEEEWREGRKEVKINASDL